MTLSGIIPIPPSIKAQSTVQDLNSRLNWGEPALTIIDVRSRNAFNVSHIMGAVSLPLTELVSSALVSLELVRDIYIYGETDEVTAEAASLLREAGYLNVAELKGGLPAWKARGFAVEGNAAIIA
ncbi:MAG: rhodanese-like domain-containing protein [Microcystaceae cyanobacterium]